MRVGSKVRYLLEDNWVPKGKIATVKEIKGSTIYFEEYPETKDGQHYWEVVKGTLYGRKPQWY